jgi:hypothetical protein
LGLNVAVQSHALGTGIPLPETGTLVSILITAPPLVSQLLPDYDVEAALNVIRQI